MRTFFKRLARWRPQPAKVDLFTWAAIAQKLADAGIGDGEAMAVMRSIRSLENQGVHRGLAVLAIVSATNSWRHPVGDAKKASIGYTAIAGHPGDVELCDEFTPANLAATLVKFAPVASAALVQPVALIERYKALRLQTGDPYDANKALGAWLKDRAAEVAERAGRSV